MERKIVFPAIGSVFERIFFPPALIFNSLTERFFSSAVKMQNVFVLLSFRAAKSSDVPAMTYPTTFALLLFLLLFLFRKTPNAASCRLISKRKLPRLKKIFDHLKEVVFVGWKIIWFLCRFTKTQLIKSNPMMVRYAGLFTVRALFEA